MIRKREQSVSGGMMEQRSPEWVAARLGKVTASRVADLMARPRAAPAPAARTTWPI